LTFAHDYVVDAAFEALMVVDEGQDEVLLLFRVDEVAIGFVVPDNWFDVVNVEIDCMNQYRCE
jgi:hypothetical protein